MSKKTQKDIIDMNNDEFLLHVIEEKYQANLRIDELEAITEEKVERVARVLHGRYKGALTIEQPHAYSAPSINDFNGAAKEALEAAIGGGDE